MTTRREALTLGALGAAGLMGVGVTVNAEAAPRRLLAPELLPIPFAGVFRRPPELEPYETGFDGGDPARPFSRYALTQKLGQAQFLPGPTTTVAGYNGMFPGPTIRARQGSRIEIRISNQLPASGLLHPDAFRTVTHLHGSATLPQYDGYANDYTAPGKVKDYRYPNWQTARTLWYHDHNHHVTAQNVYSGLAGFYTMSDRFDEAQLPQGEYDVPLMVSDAAFNADGSLAYDDNFRKGVWGDVIMVNGVPWPTMKVKRRVYRFRFLIASISRSYRPTLSTKDPVYIVGTDAGMVPVVQPVSSWRQGTAERYEVLVDFRKYRVGQTIDLRNLSNKNNIDYANTNKIMRFEVVDSVPDSHSGYVIPTTLEDGGALNPLQGGIATMKLTPEMAVAKRTMRLERQNGTWKINDKTWTDVEKSGLSLLFANPKPYDIEQWTITNGSGGWFHPLHIHLIDAKIIARNTNGGKPFTWETGPKDTFYIGENETVTALMQFDTGLGSSGGRYMVHCHNLVHEDHDMMVQFAVGDWRNNDPVTSAPAYLDVSPMAASSPTYRTGYAAGT